MGERVARLVLLVLLGLCLGGPPYIDGDSVVLAQAPDAPGNAVSAGELLVEPPTLISLGFEWSIEGDDNRNAAVEVSYRRQGETAWSPALPLRRLQRERIFVGSQFDVVVPNMFAGSILDGPASSSSRGRRGSRSRNPASRTSGSASSPTTRGRATSTSPTNGSTAGTTRSA